MGHWPLDETRRFRESLHPADYYASSYYEIWLKALEVLVVRHGLATPEELMAGELLTTGASARNVLRGADVPAFLAKGSPYARPIDAAPRFAAGDRVRARNFHPTGHTRLPRYVRGKPGVIETVHECHVFPDTNARGEGENPQRLYTVVFAASELWGESADPTQSVSIDAWESYLEPA
jgi:nitrile hydratase